MTPRGCWVLVGLAMVCIGSFIVWWANYSMVSRDMEAPFVIGAMGFCAFVPVGLLCLLIAPLVRGKSLPEEPSPRKENRELSEKAAEFRWRAQGEDEPRDGKRRRRSWP